MIINRYNEKMKATDQKTIIIDNINNIKSIFGLNTT